MKTVLYIRVSTKEQAKEGFSIPFQKEKLCKYCEMMNWDIVDIYSDEGISGSTIEKRPAATRMLQDAKKKLFENILILRVDRLCRNTKDLLEIVDLLKEYDISLNAIDQQIDYKTSIGKMTLTILGTFAEFEHSIIHERMMEGKRQKATTTGIKMIGRRIPYGYDYIDKKLIANQFAPTIKLIFEKVAEGYGYNSTATFLRKNNVPTIDILDWNRTQIKRIINNKVYMGHCCVKFDRVEVVDVIATNVEPIISEELWHKANDIQAFKTKNGIKKYAYDDFIFADVLYCSKCGWKMSSKKYKRKSKSGKFKHEYRFYRYYKCIYNESHPSLQTCNTKIVNAEKFEKDFIDFVKNYRIQLKRQKGKQIQTSSFNNDFLEKELENLLRQKSKLLDKYLNGFIEDEMYFSKNSTLTDEIKSVKEKIENKKYNNKEEKEINLNYLESIKVILSDIWDIMNDKEKRTFVSSTFEKILIDNGEIKKVIFR